jgi:hypothetical protein
MKHISILFLFFFYFISIYAQDTISLKNGVILNASILEKSRTNIKYRLNNHTSDDTINITKLSKVKSIHYQNGEVDLLSSENPRSIFPFGVNVGYMFIRGYSFFPVSLDYMLTPNISAELSFCGFFKYPSQYTLSLGGKYWFAKKYGKSGFSPFTGLFYTKMLVENYDYMWENMPQWSSYDVIELPIGISYITKFGLQTSLQLNSYIGPDVDNFIAYGLEFRVGWRFKTSKKGY